MLRTSTRASLHDLRSPSVVRLCRGAGTQWLRIAILMVIDAALLSLAWRIAEIFGTPWAPVWTIQHNPLSLLPVLGTALGVFLTGGFYRAGKPRRDYIGLIRAITVAEVLLLLIAYFYQPNQFVSRSHFVLFWLLSITLVCAGRLLFDACTNSLRHKGIVCYPVFLICDQPHLDQSVKLITRENQYNIVGIADARSLDRAEREKTFAKIRSLGIVEVFVSWDAIERRQYICWHFRNAGIKLHVIPIGLEPLLMASQFDTSNGFPTLSFTPPMLTGIDFFVKQLFDYCAAFTLVIIISPLYLIIALLIKLDSPGPIFYRQTRVGLHGKPFKVWKFRTMVANADVLQKELEAQNETKDGILFKIKNDPRMTRMGAFLRPYSLDELPQLFNVLMGEMSLVGPRPLPLRDVEKFSEHHFIRQEVLPGITGLWQVSGRSNIDSFEEVVSLDLSYIENWSLWLDLSILIRTVKVVFQKAGAY